MRNKLLQIEQIRKNSEEAKRALEVLKEENILDRISREREKRK